MPAMLLTTAAVALACFAAGQTSGAEHRYPTASAGGITGLKKFGHPTGFFMKPPLPGGQHTGGTSAGEGRADKKQLLPSATAEAENKFEEELSTLTQGSSPWLSAHSSEIRKEMQRRPNWLQDALDRKMGGPNKEKVLPARVRSTASRSPGTTAACRQIACRLWRSTQLQSPTSPMPGCCACPPAGLPAC